MKGFRYSKYFECFQFTYQKDIMFSNYNSKHIKIYSCFIILLNYGYFQNLKITPIYLFKLNKIKYRINFNRRMIFLIYL